MVSCCFVHFEISSLVCLNIKISISRYWLKISAIVIFNAEFVFYIYFDSDWKSVQEQCVYAVALRGSKLKVFNAIRVFNFFNGIQRHTRYFTFGAITNLTYSMFGCYFFLRRYYNNINIHECRVYNGKIWSEF